MSETVQKTILVTGASKGLGAELTRRLIESRAHVIALSRTRGELSDFSQQDQDSVTFVECDLAHPRELKPILNSAIPSNQKIHGLVNNAASAYDDLATNLDLDKVERLFSINVFAAMELSKWTIRRMLLHRVPGSIVHISSVCAHTGYKGLSMYAASKGAIEAFSKNLSREWGRMGIRSNCVVPGFMETEMSASLDDTQKQKIYARTALNRPTSKSSVAETVQFLLGEGSSSVTGQNFSVDSGTL